MADPGAGRPAVPPFTTRPLTSQDQAQLWEWLHIALWDPPPAPPRPREVLRHPGVRIYAENWGRPGDVGVVGQANGADIGACWMRLVPDGAGLAHVDARTPQLGIAIVPTFQRKGFGEPLMRAALQAAVDHGFAQVALTVHPGNPAIALYARCGFVDRGERNTYRLMVCTL